MSSRQTRSIESMLKARRKQREREHITVEMRISLLNDEIKSAFAKFKSHSEQHNSSSSSMETITGSNCLHAFAIPLFIWRLCVEAQY